jgi:hypothetical protein
MSWWETHSGEILGDRPADVLGKALAKAPGRQPSLQEVLDAAAVALRDSGLTRLTAVSPHGPRLAARPEAAEPALAAALTAAFAEVAGVYREYQEREPTLAEEVGTLEFVLGAPEAFLADAAEIGSPRHSYAPGHAADSNGGTT